jgi:hypothetical protein
MGIDVRLETERAEPIGETISDSPAGYLAQALAAAKGSCIGFIDPYGNTVFNQLQLPVLIRELEELQKRLPPHLSDHVHGVLSTLRSGLDRPHIYARFIGD